MSLTPGTKLGPYEIQSPLGAGGMGEVYRAMDTRLDRTVAIKVLPSHLSSDPELKQHMEREAKAISALQHANICTLHDVGSQGGADGKAHCRLIKSLRLARKSRRHWRRHINTASSIAI
jgi:eukaryotic-like serine/threonine-protein kinase